MRRTDLRYPQVRRELEVPIFRSAAENIFGVMPAV
jgi:hypothetical protein